jgi:hypothetical protein
MSEIDPPFEKDPLARVVGRQAQLPFFDQKSHSRNFKAKLRRKLVIPLDVPGARAPAEADLTSIRKLGLDAKQKAWAVKDELAEVVSSVVQYDGRSTEEVSKAIGEPEEFVIKIVRERGTDIPRARDAVARLRPLAMKSHELDITADTAAKIYRKHTGKDIGDVDDTWLDAVLGTGMRLAIKTCAVGAVVAIAPPAAPFVVTHFGGVALGGLLGTAALGPESTKETLVGRIYSLGDFINSLK